MLEFVFNLLGRFSMRLVVAELVKLVQLRRLESLSAKNLRLDPVWENLADLVVHMLARWNSEDVVKFCGCGVSKKFSGNHT